MKIKEFAFLAFLFINISMSFSQQNIVKFGIVDIVKLNLSYERVLNNNQSLGLNIAILRKINIPHLLLSDELIELNTETELSGYSIIPEYRFYTGKKGAPRGFYIAPYLKFSKYSLSFKDDYNGEQLEVTGGYNSLGLGVQLGVQWIISDVFTIDWNFLGFELDRNTISLEFTSDSDIIDFEALRNEINNDYSDIPIIGKRLIVDSGDDFVNGKASFLLGGIRSGISIGFAF